MNKEIELHSGYKIIEFKELDSTMITLKELAITGCDVIQQFGQKSRLVAVAGMEENGLLPMEIYMFHF